MLTILLNGLAWLGARGTSAVALSVIVGLCLPPLSAFAKPFLSEAVFALLVIAFVQVDLTALLRNLRRPALLATSVVWMMIVIPLVSGLTAHAFGLPEASPDLMLALFIVTAVSPITSASAFANLLRLDGSLSLSVLVLGMICVPITAPLVGKVFFDEALPISATSLALRLGFLLMGAVVVAAIIRWLTGAELLARNGQLLNGLNVVILFFFAVAVMDGVAASIINRPLLTLAMTVLTFVVAGVQMALTMAILFRVRRADAFTISLAVGNRNLGLMIAAMASGIPELTWLYFALAQLPIYFMPYLLRHVARRLQTTS